METCVIDLPYRGKQKIFRLYFFSDLHLGSVSCAEDKLKSDIEQVRQDDDAKVFILGDVCDYISPHDWRWRSNGISEWVDSEDLGKSQSDYAIELFQPVKHKILGAISGNHEDAIHQLNAQNVHKHLVDALGVRDFGYMAFIKLSFAWERGTRTGKNKHSHSGDYFALNVLLHHGFGGGRTDGSDLNKFNEFALGYDADLIVAGHTHQRNASKDKVYYLDSRGSLCVRYRIKARAGTYLKTVFENSPDHSYSERGGMRPRVEGCLVVTVRPHSKEMMANV
jgi:predicted phosphodiesterase